MFVVMVATCITRCVQQKRTMSLELLTLVLEEALKIVNWANKDKN